MKPLAIAAVGAAAALAWQLPDYLPKEELRGVPDANCDLQQGACSARLPDGSRLELAFNPRPIPVQQPMSVVVSLNGLEARKVEVDFSGETMNMGFNRATLSPSTPGHHTGEAALSVCVSGGMNWVATVLVETRRQRIAVPFHFHVGS